MKNSTAIIIGLLIITGTWFLTTRDTRGSEVGTPTMNFPKGSEPKKNDTGATSENSVIKDGIQYITINVRGGYSPRSSTAKAGIPTKLIMKTDGTYDCSASLVIKSLGYRSMLPATGETVIDAGTPKNGDTLQGVCGMGMYSFVVKFG